MKAILGNATMIKAYRDGIPANGTAVPDGAALAKIEWLKDRDESPYGVTVPGTQTEMSFMVKDSKRFPDTNGWGYATFAVRRIVRHLQAGHNQSFFARAATRATPQMPRRATSSSPTTRKVSVISDARRSCICSMGPLFPLFCTKARLPRPSLEHQM